MCIFICRYISIFLLFRYIIAETLKSKKGCREWPDSIRKKTMIAFSMAGCISNSNKILDFTDHSWVALEYRHVCVCGCVRARTCVCA